MVAGPIEQPRPTLTSFPRTRYLGSKRRTAAATLRQLGGLTYDTVLDAFGGTGAVSYAFKLAGKAVTYNDLLAFNHQIGVALIQNDTARLDSGIIQRIGERQPGVTYGGFVERTFDGIYFTRMENRWLDVAATNVRRITDEFHRAIAWFALFQAMMAKRPYNLFHRRNLYMRMAKVSRTFGNKATWDRSFADHFREYAAQANAAVFDSGGRCRVRRTDALAIEPGFDLVYIDPPYINRAGVGVDYRDVYHFLEGMMLGPAWGEAIDYESKHLRLRRAADPWSDPRQCQLQFRRLVDRFRDSILVVSYRNDGIPSIRQLRDMLRGVKRRVRVIAGKPSTYALSTRRGTKEVLLIAED